MKTQAKISSWAVGLILLAGCADREAQSISRKTLERSRNQLPTVQTISPRQDSIEKTVTGTGIVVSEDELTVSSELAGRIERVLVKEGDAVSVGQVIAYLDAGSLRIQKEQARAQTQVADAQLQLANRTAALSPARTIAQMQASEEEVRAAEAEVRRLTAGARVEELASARADVTSAEATLDQATKDLRRNQKLAAVGGISQASVDAAVAQRQVADSSKQKAEQSVKLLLAGARPEEIQAAKARVRQAQQNLEAAKANVRLESTQQDQVAVSRAQVQVASTGVRSAEDSLRRTAIRSTLAGRIYGRALKAGSVVNPGEAIAQIVGERSTSLEIELPATQIGLIRSGQTASVRLETGQTLRGKVSVVSPKAERSGRVYRVKVALSNGPSVTLGAFGRLSILVDSTKGWAIPIAALRGDNGSESVLVVRNGQTEARRVTVLSRNADSAIVSGVEADSRIVLKGPTDLTPGTKVNVEGGSL